MQLIPTILAGCFQIQPLVHTDLRGSFIKTYHEDIFRELGLSTVWREEYYSTSCKGVIRGMHFQMPPHDHEKIVYCLKGRVLDVIVDLRAYTPTFGQYVAVELNSECGHGMIVPKGMAHGFLALTEDAILSYKVATVYAAPSDAGIHWNSFGFHWGVADPLISERDQKHPPFANFQTPFITP